MEACLKTGIANHGYAEVQAVISEYVKLARGKRNTIEKLRIDRGHIAPDFDRLAQALRKIKFPE